MAGSAPIVLAGFAAHDAIQAFARRAFAPYHRTVEVACAHVSWCWRGYILRGQATCFALIVVGTGLIYLGHQIPDWVVALRGSSLLGAWCSVYGLVLWLEKRDRGHAGTLVLDGRTIALMRGSRGALATRARRFRERLDVRQQSDRRRAAAAQRNLLVAYPEHADDARRYLDATGLDAPSRTLTMPLDDGLADWLWQALIFALSILSLSGIVLWLVPVTSIPGVAVDAILAIVSRGSSARSQC